MTRLRQVLLTAILLTMLLAAGGAAMAANTGYIGTGNVFEVYKFDTSTYQVTSTMTIGTGAIDLILSESGDKLYVLGSNKIEAYNLGNGQKIGSISITPGAIIDGTLLLSNDGLKLYAILDRYVYTVNTASFTLTSNVSISNTHNGCGYADKDSSGFLIYIPIEHDLVVYSTLSGAVEATYTMPYGGTAALYDNSNFDVIVATGDANKVLVVQDPIFGGSVLQTINVSGNVQDVRFNPDLSQIIAADYNNSQLTFIDAENYTVISNLSIGARPFKITSNQDNNKEFVVCTNDLVIKVVDPSSRSVTSTITLGRQPYAVAVPKFNDEGTQYYAPHSVKYHLTSFIRDQSNITANVTDENGVMIASGRTGTDGVVVFQLYSDRYYTVTFQDGSEWEGYPADAQYDIFYLGFSLGSFMNPGSGAPAGHEDQLEEITGNFTGTIDTGTGTGTLTCLYNDTSGGTTSVNFSLYYRNTTAGCYDLVESQVVSANNASAIFTILNAGGKGYRVLITAQNNYYGEVLRKGDWTFDGGYSYDMKWPGYMYVAFCFVMSIIIGFNTSRDFYITIGGGTLFIGFNWCFYLIGWTSGMGLIIPVGLSVCTIILALFAVGEWRTMTGV